MQRANEHNCSLVLKKLDAIPCNILANLEKCLAIFLEHTVYFTFVVYRPIYIIQI
jgi:hypothetical protein